MIKNIVFDMGGVLVGFDGERCINKFKALGAERTLDYIVRHRTEDLFADIEDGRITTEEFCDKVRELDNITADNQSIIDAWCSLLLPCPPEKNAALRKLKSMGYRLFLLSNTNEMHWEFASKSIEVDIFEQCFLSMRMGLRKPDVKIYEEVCRSAGIQANETIFVDDTPINLDGAHRAGLRIYLERSGTDWCCDLLPNT